MQDVRDFERITDPDRCADDLAVTGPGEGFSALLPTPHDPRWARADQGSTPSVARYDAEVSHAPECWSPFD